MSIEENLDDKSLRTSAKDMEKTPKKFGKCSFSSTCWLYTPGDYHCNINRGIFLKNGMTQPSCYQERKDE